MVPIHYSCFAIDESPFCVWEWDLPRRNRSFIDRIDPDYFTYFADTHEQALQDEEHKRRAAMALRMAYSHALETLFACLFAAVQAPDCVVGWLHNYRTNDLLNLVRKAETGRPILTKIKIGAVTWESLSAIILKLYSIDDKGKEDSIKKGFSSAWARFAADFLNDECRLEYNSIKHGLRLGSGGFTLEIGPEETPGSPAAAESMRSLGGSDFGSLFYIPERIGDYRQHFRVRECWRNWRPEHFSWGLRLISLSIKNILTFLRAVNCTGGPMNLRFVFPTDVADFQKPWQPTLGVTSISFDIGVPAEHITPFTKEEILSRLRMAAEANNQS